MHSIHSRYHKLTGRPSKKKQAAIEKAKKRWSEKKTGNVSSDSNLKIETTAMTTSEKKIIESSFSTPSQCTSASPNYVLMNTSMWSSLLSNIKCTQCLKSSLKVECGNTFGYCCKIELVCNECKTSFGSSYSSSRLEGSTGFEANKKIVEAFLKIGKGHSALETFSSALGMQSMDKKTFANCLTKISEEKKIFKNEVLEIARKIVRSKYEDLQKTENDSSILDVTVSYDGTWHKRGYTSLYGIGFVVDALTGIVVDYEIMSKYCEKCATAKREMKKNSAQYDTWYKTHKADCCINYCGSSNAMEMTAAGILWQRSIKDCGMRYINIISDGDAKTFQYLLSKNIYGKNCVIKKEECINHVAKRLGTALRNKVKEWRMKGVTIGGRKEGNLKEETIVKLTNFYRKAIKTNVPDTQKMKTAIYATLYHCSSTDKSPKHNKCPTGKDSWCFYQRAIANNEEPSQHKTMKTKLSEDVLVKILPVYQRLANDELLQRCSSGKTQNISESLHNVVWNNCPKEHFVSKKRLEIAVINGVSEFNFGCVNTLHIEDSDAASFSLSIATKKDNRRIYNSKRKSSESFKNARKQKKIKLSIKDSKNKKHEGETYGAGKF